MIVLQLGKLERGEGHFTYQFSALHLFPFFWLLFLRFLFLLNSFYWKLFFFLPSLSRVFRPSPFALFPHWLGGHSRETPNLLTVTDGCAEAHNGRRRHVISLAAGLRKKEPKPKSDLREADLIKVIAKGRAACGLHSLPSARDKALRCFSRRKIQESHVGRMLKGGEKRKDNRDVFDKSVQVYQKFMIQWHTDIKMQWQ